jgi:hypothetical protein
MMFGTRRGSRDSVVLPNDCAVTFPSGRFSRRPVYASVKIAQRIIAKRRKLAGILFPRIVLGHHSREVLRAWPRGAGEAAVARKPPIQLYGPFNSAPR